MSLIRRSAPGPEGQFLLGSSLEFQKQPLDFFMKVAREYDADVVQFRIGYENWYLLKNAEHVNDVLVNKAALFHKPKLVKRFWELFLGNGLLASDGDFWKRQHKLVLPGFHKKRIDAYGEIMVAYTQDMLATFAEGEQRQVHEDMTQLTLGIVAKTLFDADVRHEAKRVGDCISFLQEVIVEHVNSPIPVPKWWPSAQNRKKMQAIQQIENVMFDLIEERRRTKSDRGDLLSLLVQAEDDQGKKMTGKELRDETMTLLFAGHETTANALSWSFYLLATHPEIEARLSDELRTVLNGRPPSVDDLKNLPYLEMFVKESMRILPSVYVYMREPQEDIQLGDYIVPKGSVVLISPYVLQHDPRYFPDPEAFRPERFAKVNERLIPRGAYVPFAAGPRVCLGKAFAMLEARLVLATIVQRMKFELSPGQEVELYPKTALRPKGGLPATVRFRSPTAD